MLSCLRIRDLAIVDELELELGPGLNMVTGETGAGKSILVGALELVLGGRGRPELVRSGAKTGEVEALFEVSGDAQVVRQLRELELDDLGLGNGGELVVRRVISACGRTRAFVNGRLTPQQTLLRVTRGLTDISSQHEHHTLTDPGTHLGYLDSFARLGPLRARVSGAYHALRAAAGALREFEARIRDREGREALLDAQIREIEEAAPVASEDIELERRCARLRSVEGVLRLVGEAAELLYERDDSVTDGLARACRRVLEASELEPELASLANQLESLRGQLEDAARELGRHIHAVRPDPEGLLRSEERLYLLSRLKRRYGGSLEAVLAHLEKARTELESLSQPAAVGEALSQAMNSALEEARGAARSLSAERRQAAARLGFRISRELESLGMGGARIQVALRPLHGRGSTGDGSAVANEEFAVDGALLSPEGLERAEFLIAPNRGEEVRPLHRVASGGELSRAMLAIKCVLADLGPSGMYVFDEIDAGVGGGMAEIIGRKIRAVASHRQVLCVTHLPQIAVFADQHFKVEKSVCGDRTVSSVRRLSEGARREEIARMLGGLKITAKT
ncbi:MAG TPA: DNA repair protein RecN, partial [Polyangiaceae bacterium]|nr:DNA repair protein RecN [Polyangiaceae bacterium]